MRRVGLCQTPARLQVLLNRRQVASLWVAMGERGLAVSSQWAPVRRPVRRPVAKLVGELERCGYVRIIHSENSDC